MKIHYYVGNFDTNYNIFRNIDLKKNQLTYI